MTQPTNIVTTISPTASQIHGSHGRLRRDPASPRRKGRNILPID